MSISFASFTSVFTAPVSSTISTSGCGTFSYTYSASTLTTAGATLSLDSTNKKFYVYSDTTNTNGWY